MTIRPVAAAAVALAALLLAGCTPEKTQVSPTDSAPESTAPAPTDGATPAPQGGSVYDQEVEWSACGELECATIQVPVDWSDPLSDTTDLAINRASSQNSDARLGSLLINPGGPGGSGLDFTESFVAMAGQELLDAYDVIGFDPRGVGESSEVLCGSDKAVDDYYLPDRPITSQADVDEWNDRNASFAQLCEADSGDIAKNVDTVSAARDMDVIRAVVGDEQLHYLGFSYGTQLGATYAELFPELVGRVVLDGAVDFLLPGEELGRGQAEGFENALTNFLRYCTSREDCPLGDDVDQARAQIQDLLAQSLADPLPTGTRWDLNGNLMVYGIVVTLYDEASWQYLQIALEEIVDSGTGSVMYELANFYLDRNGATGEYLSNSTWAFTAINCLDAIPEDEWTFEDIEEFRALMEEASPTFGWWFASSTGCDGWPWTGDQHIESLENAATAEQMLVVGTTNDPATPLKWSESLADRLGAELLVYDGEGHTAYGRSNQCVVDAVDGFLVDGEMPDSGTEC